MTTIRNAVSRAYRYTLFVIGWDHDPHPHASGSVWETQLARRAVFGGTGKPWNDYRNDLIDRRERIFDRARAQ